MDTQKDDHHFAIFGTVGFVKNSKVNAFVDALQQGEIRGTRCTKCGRMFFPPRADCFRCLTSPMQWFEVSGNGKLLSFSRLTYAPAGFEEDLPYIIAILNYGAFKVFGRIANHVPAEELRIGMNMQTVVNELPNGRRNYVFQTAEIPL